MKYSNWSVLFLKIILATTFLLSGIFLNTKAQTLETTIDVIGVGSSSGQTPFWIESNRYGRYASDGSHLLTRLQVFGRSNSDSYGPFEFSYGADFVVRPGSQNTASLNQAYLKISAYNIEFAGGRFHTRSPVHDEKLSMGSLGVSGNAVPVPQIRLGLPEWTGIPFTRDLIQIKGHVAHGWLEADRFTRNPLYHEKVGHARFGGNFPLNVYGGLAHYAMWGGTDNPQFGDLPAEFSDFFRVFIGIGGDDDAPDVEADYLLGDHLGAWDFGFFLELDDLTLNFYRQHPIETKDNLKLKSLQDALNGISIRFDDDLNLPIKGVAYEFMYTKWQDGPKRENILDDGTRCSEFPDKCRDNFKGNENYYNHHIYRVGWATHGRTIGNPLFRTSGLPVESLVDGIINNRIIAHHIGLDANIGKSSVVAKITASRNFGTRNDPFPEPADQFSIGFQTQTPVTLFNQPFILLADLALDNGDLVGNQFGAAIGLRWSR